MHLSINFVTTPADGRQLFLTQGSHWLLVFIQPVVAVKMLDLGIQHSLTVGLDWESVLHFGLFLLICTPYIFLWYVPKYFRRRYHVLIEDETVTTECKNYKKTIQWTSFVRFGSATEQRHHFWLRCGRGDVCIPKRAFLTDSDLTAFRQFVSEKMGDRCKFRIDKQPLAESTEEVVAC